MISLQKQKPLYGVHRILRIYSTWTWSIKRQSCSTCDMAGTTKMFPTYCWVDTTVVMSGPWPFTLSVKHIQPGNGERGALLQLGPFLLQSLADCALCCSVKWATVSSTNSKDIPTCGGISSSLLVNPVSPRYKQLVVSKPVWKHHVAVAWMSAQTLGCISHYLPW